MTLTTPSISIVASKSPVIASLTAGSSTPMSALNTIVAESPPAAGNSAARRSMPVLLSDEGAVILDVKADPTLITAPARIATATSHVAR